MKFDVIPIISGLLALFFVFFFGRARWERTHEGRNLMLTSVAVVLIAIGSGTNLYLIEDVGWFAMIFAMGYRIVLLLRAQKEGRRLHRNLNKT